MERGLMERGLMERLTQQQVVELAFFVWPFTR